MQVESEKHQKRETFLIFCKQMPPQKISFFDFEHSQIDDLSYKYNLRKLEKKKKKKKK